MLTLPLTMICAGCVTPQGQKTTVTPPPSSDMGKEDAPKAKVADGPKRSPKAATEIAFGKMRESEADSEAMKQNPETRSAFRDEARKAYQQALKIDPNNLEAYRSLGRLYVKVGDFERAQDVYKKAMAKNPKDASLWYELGLCHNRQKNFAEGVRCFSKALEHEPENREYLKKLGYTLAWTGKVDQGLVYLTQAHGAAQAHFKIACMFDQKDQSEQAIHHLRLALRENSQLQDARALLTALENPGVNPTHRAVLASPVFGG
jgi:tetratricopeptide (TPR) repeat protein